LLQPEKMSLKSFDVIIRNDLRETHGKALLEVLENLGVNFVSHNIINNYGKKGHIISSFCTNNNWQDYYWPKQSKKDPSDKIGHSKALEGKNGMINWNAMSASDEISKNRLSFNKCEKGFSLFFPEKKGILENLSIGWKDKECGKNESDIKDIIKIIDPLRANHSNTFT
jgi:hypothetical protein